MNKTDKFKIRIINNIIILFVLILLQVSLAFAWFTEQNLLNVRQEIIVGEFLVELNKNSDMEGGVYANSDINYLNAYPLTKAVAEQTDNFFMAKIVNNGNIAAMFRMSFELSNLTYTKTVDNIQSEIDLSDKITEFFEKINFSVYTKIQETDDFAAFETGGTNSGNLSTINSFLNQLTCEVNPDDTQDYIFSDFGKINGRTQSTQNGLPTVVPGESRYIKIFMWLSDSVQLGDGADGDFKGFGYENINFNIAFKLEAIQVAEGTSWKNFDIGTAKEIL